MKRLVLDELLKWKNSSRRKPLVLRGARQVGKTWILEEFGKTFKDGYIRIDFYKQPEYKQLFSGSKDVLKIIRNIELASGEKITKDTLIIFDEIQACPGALNSLKYFCEDAREYAVASAGSLLGISLAEGFPVGKVDFIDMAPMTFKEFLYAVGENGLVEYIESINTIENIPDLFVEKLQDNFKTYFITGGMPEAIKVWVEDGDFKSVEKTQSDILDAYDNDFGKHVQNKDIQKVRLIWNSLPSQLAKENKKFLYSAAKEGARAREYEDALNWLKNADIVKKVSRISKPALPISAYEDLSAFKIYMLDVGLLRRHAHLAPTVLQEGDRLFVEFKGALTENYVAQALSTQFEVEPYYWGDAPYEVDFIIQRDNEIYPIEAKAGENVSAASLKRYIKDYTKETNFGIRLSLKNLSFDGKILNVPLYLADELDRLIGVCKETISK